jgi:uncharacterized protein (UPF0305 family)
MPFQLEITRDMEEYEQEVSVVDVYDIASEIGKEFEKIIDAYGTEAVTSLMPKVINALEHLEGLATKNERENTTVQELKARIAQLESDKVEKAEDRQRFEKVRNLVSTYDAYNFLSYITYIRGNIKKGH